MGYLPQFKNDLFVSYRRASNDTRDKWVDAFCEALRASLVELVGEVSIWRDEPQMVSGEPWRPQIIDALDSAAIFVAVISNTYFKSDECRREFDQFLGRLKDPQGGDQRKIIPIFKQPASGDDELPRELSEIHRHEFFHWNPPGSRYWRELMPERDGASDSEFWATLSRLAQDITRALESLKGEANQRAIGKVFLARASPELQLERERLRADLQQRGYLVVPEHEVLWNAADHRQKIADDLEGALLAIHLVARSASVDRDAATHARLQLELAHAAMRQAGRPAPLVWIQPADETNSSASGLIDYIEGTLANDGVEYWRGGLEDLKTQVYDKLAPRTAPAAAMTPPSRQVALLHEDGELEAVTALKDLLVEQWGLNPRPIKFAGSLPRDATRLTSTLAVCDQVLVFWARQPEEWVQDILDLGAMAGHLGRDRTCVYAVGPPSAEKAAFRTTQARTIDAVAAPNQAELKSFLHLT